MTGPQLTPSVRAVEPGQRVELIFTGWTARYATLSVCGNLAKRGSADCNMVESTGVRLKHLDEEAPCRAWSSCRRRPTARVCIRAVGGDNGEVAVAPINLIGHPISAVVDPNLGQPVIDVGLSTRGGAPRAWLLSLRGALGGASPQEATVTVTNLTTDLISNVAVHGTVQRRGSTLAEFDLQTGEIGPGQTWTGTAVVTLPAPTIGTYDWQVTASGAGPVMTAGTTSQSIPWLFVLLLLVFVAVVVAIAVRAADRRRDPSRRMPLARQVDPDEVIDIRGRDQSTTSDRGWADTVTRENEPVGAASGGGRSPS